MQSSAGILAFPASLIVSIRWQGVGTWSGFDPSAPFFWWQPGVAGSPAHDLLDAETKFN
jgi:hypothetical protein